VWAFGARDAGRGVRRRARRDAAPRIATELADLSWLLLAGYDERRERLGALAEHGRIAQRTRYALLLVRLDPDHAATHHALAAFRDTRPEDLPPELAARVAWETGEHGALRDALDRALPDGLWRRTLDRWLMHTTPAELDAFVAAALPDADFGRWNALVDRLVQHAPEHAPTTLQREARRVVRLPDPGQRGQRLVEILDALGAHAAVLDLLADGDTGTRRAALRAALQGPIPGAVEILRAQLFHRHDAVAEIAAEGLAVLGAPEDLGRLRQRLRGAAATTTQAAIRKALLHIEGRAPSSRGGLSLTTDLDGRLTESTAERGAITPR
jgi:hypothetical protein